MKQCTAEHQRTEHLQQNNPQENTRYFKACCTQGTGALELEKPIGKLTGGFEGMRSTITSDKPAQQVIRSWLERMFESFPILSQKG